MIVVVDDERTYAELFCENLARVLVENGLIPDSAYSFSFKDRLSGYVVLLNNFNEAMEFISDYIDQIDFITFDIIMTLPSGIEEIIQLLNIEDPTSLEAGSYLFQMLVANGIITNKVNRFAIITHLKDYDAGKLISNLEEDLRPSTHSFENRILQKNYVNVPNDVHRVFTFLKEEKIDSISISPIAFTHDMENSDVQ